MLRILLLFSVSFVSFFVTAEIKLISFYFEGSSLEVTSATREDLIVIKAKQELNEFQIIEMNSYAASSNSTKIAEERAEFILEFFAIDKESINLNCLGSKKEALNFRPLSWDRIDVYYFLGDLKDIPAPVVIEKRPEIIKVNNPKPEKVEEVKEPEIIENVPIVLPIKFEGGTAKVLDESTIFMEELYFLLKKNPQYNAEIKGHVCCEDNYRMSKKRARVVYDYLVGKGILEERLSYEGYSNNQPVVFPERAERDRAKNRRVEVVFSK